MRAITVLAVLFSVLITVESFILFVMSGHSGNSVLEAAAPLFWMAALILTGITWVKMKRSAAPRRVAPMAWMGLGIFLGGIVLGYLSLKVHDYNMRIREKVLAHLILGPVRDHPLLNQAGDVMGVRIAFSIQMPPMGDLDMFLVYLSVKPPEEGPFYLYPVRSRVWRGPRMDESIAVSPLPQMPERLLRNASYHFEYDTIPSFIRQQPAFQPLGSNALTSLCLDPEVKPQIITRLNKGQAEPFIIELPSLTVKKHVTAHPYSLKQFYDAFVQSNIPKCHIKSEDSF